MEMCCASLADAGQSLEAIGRALAAQVADNGRVAPARLQAIQYPAFGYARALAQHAAARACCAFATGAGALEQSLARAYCAETLADLHTFTTIHQPTGVREVRAAVGSACGPRRGLSSLAAVSTPSRRLAAHIPHLPAQVGWADPFPLPPWVPAALASDALAAAGRAILARGRDWAGANDLGVDHQAIRQMFAAFADARVAPLAERTHREDRLIPESLIAAYAELGVFGVSIPPAFGGSFVDHLTMVLASEELSRASVGIGGSVVTRPEIAAKAILAGGSDAQKAYWLPLLAQGKKMVCVAVTEPGAGSDVARVRLAAAARDGGVVLNGEKTWCTFAGRSDVMLVLARTGTIEEGHKGLTLFLVEKPVAAQEYAFRCEQPGGGVMEGKAIATVGYRGMHSFVVSFQDWFVPTAHQIGQLGQGFYLTMQGFAGGRIQTAARALGVMEGALRAAIGYVKDRQVFGQSLGDFPLAQVRLAQMAAKLQACRRLAYATCALMDTAAGAVEAAQVKLLACREAEWVTREAMQLHGGMGYAEEYPVSRYWQDARVFSLFEGAEEVLAILVVARAALEKYLDVRSLGA